MNTTQSRCDALFEPLSAWVDGMADADETRAVESHLQRCAACREVEQALRAVSLAASAPPQEIPTGFAARTARLVRERAENTWDARMKRAVRRAASWIDNVVPAPRKIGAPAPTPALAGAAGQRATASPDRAEPHPLSALLHTRALRAGLRPASFWMTLAVLLYGVPTVALETLRAPEAGRFYLGVVALALMVALPWFHLRTDVSLLVSLRKGHCLDELIVSGLGASGIADTLARHSVTSLVRVGWPVALVLLLGSAFSPTDERALAVAAALLWLPCVCAVFMAGSYAVQAVVVYARAGEGASLPSAGVVLWLVVPSATLVYLFGTSSPAMLATSASLALIWVGFQGRFLTVWGLEHMPLLERWTRNEISRRRNRFIGARSQNPITIREYRRQASAVPAGLLGLFIVRLLPALVPAGALLTLTESESDAWMPAWWLGVAVLAWLTFLRAAAKTSSAVVQEREQGTLDALVQSGLTSREFVRGWLEVACWPLYLELGVAVSLGAILALAAPEVLAEGSALSDWTHVYGTLALAIAVLALMPWAGAWTGLGVSSISTQRREAGGQTVLLTLRAVGSWLAVCGLMVALAFLVAQGFGLALDSARWSSVVGVVLPLASLGFVAVWCAWRGRVRVERHLAACWNEVPPVPETAKVRFALQKRLVMGSFGAAGVALGLHFGAMAFLVSVTRWSMTAMDANVLIVPSMLVAAACIATVLWACRPLLDAVVDRIGASIWRVSALAGVGGGLAGGMMGSIPALVALPVALGLLPEAWSDTHGLPMSFAVAASAGLGFLVCGGVTAAVLVARARPEDAAGRASPASVKRVAVRCLAIVAVLGALTPTAGEWMIRGAGVQVENPAFLEKVLARVNEREAQRLRVKAADNGFAPLAAALMTREGEATSPRIRQLQDGFSSLTYLFSQGKRADVIDVLQGMPVRARTSAAMLDAVLPLVREAVSRPAFLSAPRLSEGMNGRGPNYILMRALSQSLSMRALMHERDGRLDAALDLHLLNLKWADRGAGQGMLIQGMIVVALKTIAEDGLLDFLGHNRLAERDYQRIIEAEQSRRMTLSVFGQHLEDELALGLDTYDRVARGESVVRELQAVGWMPSFWLKRDRAVYTNGMLRQLSLSANGNPRELARPFREDEMLSQPAFLAAMLFPNARRAVMQVRLSESRSEAIRLICTLELMRLRDGAYPTTLPAGFIDATAENGTFDYTSDGKTYTLRSTGVLVRQLVWGDQKVVQWMPRVQDER